MCGLRRQDSTEGEARKAKRRGAARTRGAFIAQEQEVCGGLVEYNLVGLCVSEGKRRRTSGCGRRESCAGLKGRKSTKNNATPIVVPPRGLYS